MRSVFVALLVAFALQNASASSGWVVNGREIPLPQAASLEQAVSIVKDLVRDGVPRSTIATWVVTLVDGRITNMNTPERLLDRRNLNPLDALAGQREFDEWRDKAEFEYRKTAAWAWEHQLGNCEENANLAYYLLRHGGVSGNVRILYAGANHVFVVWGIKNGANPADPLSWGPDAIVVDPWYGGIVTDMHTVANNYWFGRGGEARIVDRTENHDKASKRWATAEQNLRPEDREFEDCFVVTAVSGSPHAQDVTVLRRYREAALRRSSSGQSFIAWYEKWGPLIAAWLRKHPGWKAPVRSVVVRPAAGFARTYLAHEADQP